MKRLRILLAIFVLSSSVVICLSFKRTWVISITMYQKYISPYKGYHCAYACLHKKGLSCSAYGKQVIERDGVFEGLKMLNERFESCSIAYHIAKIMDKQSLWVANPGQKSGCCIENCSCYKETDEDMKKSKCCNFCDKQDKAVRDVCGDPRSSPSYCCRQSDGCLKEMYKDAQCNDCWPRQCKN